MVIGGGGLVIGLGYQVNCNAISSEFGTRFMRY